MEACYLKEKKALLTDEAFAKIREVLSDSAGVFECAPLGHEIASRLPEIPRASVKDPWDRIIAVTALERQLPLITRDRLLSNLVVIETIWSGIEPKSKGAATEHPLRSLDFVSCHPFGRHQKR